ncbi:MAG: HEAT repeat domain-containing protein [Phototrophicaceae bacterium]|jgi:HEAT repeat protein
MTDDLAALIETLQSGTAPQRRQAVFKLGQMRNVALVNELCSAASDPDDGVRAFAASGLAALGAAAMPKLQTMLAEGDALAQQTAQAAIRHIGDKR